MKKDDLFSHPIHVAVYFTGRCPACNTYSEEQIHDYGRMPYGELEKRMDETDHQVRPIRCSSCGASFSPSHLIYREMDMKETIARQQIEYGLFDRERFEREKEGQARRFEVFRQYEEEFWRGYEDYALEHWQDALQELRPEEFREAYEALGLPEPKTLVQYRRDALQRFRTDAEKRAFWRAANRSYIYDYVLEIGPLGWEPEKEVKEYGRHRVRYVILHFPLYDALEQKRTEYIGRIVRKEKGDNAFLFRRIAQLTQELERARRKVTDYFHRLQEARHEIARLQNDLAEAYEEIRRAREDRHVSLRDPDDIRKIRELKGLVRELIAEMRELETKLPADVQPPEVQEEEKDVEERLEETVDLSALAGKTIGILGGMRREQVRSREWPCEILTHPADKPEPEYYQTMERADILVVITTHISHAAMWETRAYAVSEGKPIVFTRHVNIRKILEEVAEYDE